MGTEKTSERSVRKVLVGEVLSAQSAKTLVVSVPSRYRHPKYGKIITRYTKAYVHDEKGEGRKGDRVRIMETRPLSKLKRWRLVEVVLRKGAALENLTTAQPVKA